MCIVSKEWDPESLFDVFGDELVRHILLLASEQPLSAEVLADHCEASLPTVYRRLDALEDLDLLQERMQVDDDGHHYRQFETTLKRLSFEISDGGFDVDIRIRRDLSNRFESFWDDLDRSAERNLDTSTRSPGDERPGDTQHG